MGVLSRWFHMVGRVSGLSAQTCESGLRQLRIPSTPANPLDFYERGTGAYSSLPVCDECARTRLGVLPSHSRHLVRPRPLCLTAQRQDSTAGSRLLRTFETSSRVMSQSCSQLICSIIISIPSFNFTTVAVGSLCRDGYPRSGLTCHGVAFVPIAQG